MSSLGLGDHSSRWNEHSGGTAHDGPEWAVGDEPLAAECVASLSPRAVSFLRILAGAPGAEFDADELAGALGVNGPAGLAGALSTFNRIRGCGRRFPFYWWKGDPTTYAMKPVTASVFEDALGL